MIIFNSVESIRECGFEWGRACRGGEVFALYGVLGAGKTQLVKGLARGLDFPGEVTSPTFTIVHEYHGGRLPLHHLDLYRLEDQNAAVRLGLEDYFVPSAVTVIEWPEKVESLLPAGTRRYEIVMASLTERLVKEKR